VNSRVRVLPLSALFAASGCAALIYQVVWFERLSLAIGASAPSLGVLLAMYLGGLGLGSLLARRWRLGRTHALLAFAVAQCCIGALGIVTPFAIQAVGSLYATAGFGGLTARALVTAATLLPPTILMGATLPLAAGSLRAGAAGGADIGYVYAANTVGAAAGSLLAGFYLLRVYDAYVATYVAVALDFAVGAASFTLAALARRDVPSVAASSPTVGVDRLAPASFAKAPWPLYVATALSGMTALAAEVLWTRHLSLLFGGTVYTFALIVAVFLVGIGVGGAAGAALGRRGRAWPALAACQALLCVAMAWAAYAIARSLPFWPLDVTLPVPDGVALQLDVVRTAWAVFPAAVLWGASLPLALAAVAAAGADPRRSIGALYGANTAGAIVGALVVTFVLVPTIGSRGAQELAILVAASAAALLLATGAPVAGASAPQRMPRVARLAAAAVVAAASALAAGVPNLPPALIAYGRFLPTRGMAANVVYVGEGVAASIAVTRELSGVLTYHNAGKTQASTYPQDLRLQRMLGHLTTLLPERPSSVLVIGLGAGITAGAVALDPAVERVVVAELEPLVPKAAAQYFSTANFGVVASPKVELRVDDGRHLLATTRATFDAITSDPLDPWVKGAAALYTSEFWRLCKMRLNPGGVVTVFVQLYESTENAVKSEIATFLDAFPGGAVFANTVEGMGYDAVLVGRADGAPIDIERIAARLGRADYARVAASLREVGFDTALDLIGTYSADADDMAAWLEGAAVNTDANLRLQYLAGRGLNARRAGDIFAALVGDGPRFPKGLFTGTAPQMEELRQRLAARRGDY
jgi:spermidine synthase